ncbi:cytochrome Bc1 complex with Stigmatellin [Rozella allomycis CSF55]|uniref:Cytochrome b-c1 complex subunit Rieske, mitochondrial n=1 Tax=Rozella allomycis (strain CSF55) TaxID=988480 RepID=A0A4P9YQQ6_ROZAC|nr:cytochrome Bc1 complex with Stigmatellin [Rozella allomycis CSF55]
MFLNAIEIEPAPLFTNQRRHYSSSNDGFFIAKEDPNYETTQAPDWSYMRRQNPNADDNRTFTYLVVGAYSVFGTIAAKCTVATCLEYLAPPKCAIAAGSVEVDLSNIPVGKSTIVTWRGKPIFIRHRTEDDIKLANDVDLSTLRDPQSDSDRVQKPEWLVMIGICTHLGCIPTGDSGDFNGWFCPCHGSHYDSSGRIRLGPAPLNLEVPKYEFLSDTTIKLG